MAVNPISATPVVVPVSPTSSNDGATIVMPLVEAPKVPPVEGETIPDAGEAAEIEILHARVGEFVQGARILRSEFNEFVDFARLVALGAIKILKDFAPVLPPSKGKK